MSFSILGTGHCVPKRVVANDELGQRVDTGDEWITQRVGVRERRVCTTESTVQLAYGAAKSAIEASGVDPGDLGLILCATISGDNVCPSVACSVQELLGASCPALDISAACSGFIYALDVAAGFFSRQKVQRALVIGAERMSALVDWSDRRTCVIFGDGAGAAVLGAGSGYLSSKLTARGGDGVIKVAGWQGGSPFYQREPPYPYVSMNGQETYKFAVTAFCTDIADVTADAGLTPGDIAWVIPHQANIRIIDGAARRLDIPRERFCSNIDRYGNTSAASIPILLDEMNRGGRLRRGDALALCSFGGGLTSAACIIRW
ncbi:MAG: ketoacyl-ACP synthase III [Oscillospiraceae bacterium]|jgi:3-oxoacyl-[acyl-carrier-protein] synthase-3|nr:ketoacyl-ACP synthase III [Oscillospiraceae bacterium]